MAVNFIAESAREGLGFNGNILETNILNLAVVVGIVVSFGGDALKGLLANRRQTVLSTLEQANQRAKEAKQRLAEAVTQLELAEKRNQKKFAQQGSSAAEKEKRGLLAQTEEDIKRLEESKEDTISLQQQKAVAQVSQQVVKLALTRVRDQINKSVRHDLPSICK